ncbi:DUF2236 domain-containing protein, partial [Pseudomonas sp. MAFF212427]
VSSFMAAHLRYRNPHLSVADQDAYYAEIAQVAERLGARNVPRTRQAVADYLQAMRPQLRCDERSREVVSVLLAAPAPSRLAKPVASLMMQAGIGLLPQWASDLLELTPAPFKARLVDLGIDSTAPVLRWAMRDSSLHRAKRRVGVA